MTNSLNSRINDQSDLHALRLVPEVPGSEYSQFDFQAPRKQILFYTGVVQEPLWSLLKA